MAQLRLAPAFLVAAVLVAGQARPAQADHLERRDYTIFIDGKEAGQSRLTMLQKKDGTTEVTGWAEAKVQLLGLSAFSYKVDSSETWKDGRLINLNAVAVENNKRTEVVVTASGDELRIRVNGVTNSLRPDVWTSSYWKLADARFHNKPVPILDADTGKAMNGQLQYVARESIQVRAKAEDCYHFRVTGIAVPIDLWFDRYHRLVRQEFTESGHKTIIQLDVVR